jgi:hypothetical protein
MQTQNSQDALGRARTTSSSVEERLATLTALEDLARSAKTTDELRAVIVSLIGVVKEEAASGVISSEGTISF